MGVLYQEYLLSLVSESNRRKRFYRQSYTENFIWVPAIHGKTEQDALSLFDDKKAGKCYQRTLSEGEKACTLSHIRIWEEFVNHSEAAYAIICEDDALLSSQYPLVYEMLAKSEDAFSILVIGESKTASFSGSRRYHLAYPMQSQQQECLYEGSTFRVGKIWKDFTCGTVGYVIHRKAAEALLRYLKYNQPFWLADDYKALSDIIESQTLDSRLYVKHMYPRLVIEDGDLVSRIESDRIQLQQSQIKGLVGRVGYWMKRIVFTGVAILLHKKRKQLLQRWVEMVKAEMAGYPIPSKDRTFSIIILVYNGEKTIRRAVESCLKQTYKNVEIIIVDDASTDSTQSVLAQFNDKRVRSISLTKNIGTFLARKKGVEASSGEYIFFLDADDELLPTCCEELNRLPEVDLAIYQYKNVRTEAISPVFNHGVVYTNEIIGDMLAFRLPFDWSIAGKVYKKTVLEKALQNLCFLNDRLINAEDLLLFVGALLEVKQAVYVKSLIYQYHQLAVVRPYQTQDTYKSTKKSLKKLISLVDVENKKSLQFLSYAYQRLNLEAWCALQTDRESFRYRLKYLIQYIRYLGCRSVLRKLQQRIL